MGTGIHATEGAWLFQAQCGPWRANDKEPPVCHLSYVGEHQGTLTRVVGSIDHAQAEKNCDNICEEKKR